MIALGAGILVASLVGSVHCVAMCGPLATLHGGARTLRLALMHALGRLATYVALGALAGGVGSAIDLAGRVGHVQRIATLLAGSLIVLLGVRSAVGRQPPGRSPRSTAGAFGSALVRIRAHRPARRAWLTGALTGLLPCGWLWAYVVTAAGTGAVLGGAAVMVAFWLGTVPAMVGLLAVAGPMVARLRARVPVATAVALIALGLGTLALRWRDAGTGQVAHPHCHEAS
jgi:sulfite exporter TauE/SafE